MRVSASLKRKPPASLLVLPTPACQSAMRNVDQACKSPYWLPVLTLAAMGLALVAR